jgi:RimJ/RimL family protein N-acetyltransferase
VHNPYLIGSSVYLRPLEREDARILTQWFNDPEVTDTLRTYRPMTVPFEEAFIRRIAKSSTDVGLAIMVREGDRFIGVCGLSEVDIRNRHAAFGINIGDKEAWGKGYGTEATKLLLRHAFLTLNLNRIWLEVYEYNPRALHVYEKLGFVIEGRLRQDMFRAGRYWDTIIMGILRQEWQDRQQT